MNNLRLACALALASCALAASAQMAYGVANDGDLYRINLTTANATVVGTTGVALPEGLAYNTANGALYMTDSAGEFYRVNATTGATT